MSHYPIKRPDSVCIFSCLQGDPLFDYSSLCLVVGFSLSQSGIPNYLCFLIFFYDTYCATGRVYDEEFALHAAQSVKCVHQWETGQVGPYSSCEYTLWCLTLTHDAQLSDQVDTNNKQELVLILNDSNILKYMPVFTSAPDSLTHLWWCSPLKGGSHMYVCLRFCCFNLNIT